jgi:hypothetical protein
VSDWVEKPNLKDQIYSATKARLNIEIQCNTLIFDRYIPPKPIEDEQRILREHKKMIEDYKERLAKDEIRKKRRKEAKIQREATLNDHLIIWQNEILPNWETKYIHETYPLISVHSYSDYVIFTIHPSYYSLEVTFPSHKEVT